MSKNNDNFREWDKKNLIDDLIIEFPKLKKELIIIRSDGSFLVGNILTSNILKNYYAVWHDTYQLWFIPIIFYDPSRGVMNKYMDINELIYSGFSYNEIILIKNVLTYGIKRDIHNVSPNFTSISRDIRIFRNNLTRTENKDNTNFNLDNFLNLPPLKI